MPHAPFAAETLHHEQRHGCTISNGHDAPRTAAWMHHPVRRIHDGNGIRTSKTVNGVEHKYYYSGGKLLRETYNGNILDFAYNPDGTLYSFRINGAYYYYVTNLQGDVISIVDAEGEEVAAYEYDPYGGIISATGSMASINPLRYRGYYYDTETGFYYLQSRYYDPEIGRFINADSLASTGQGLLGNNMFAYCGNSPASGIDQAGNSYKLCTMEMYDANLDYIYNQKDEPYASMPLGESTVGRDGCAIVATYNAMISLGNPRPFSEIYNYYITRLVNNGKDGIFIASVAQYFINEGYRVCIFTSHTPSEVESCSQNADASIMLYRYKSSNRRYGHYVEYSPTNDGYLAKNISGYTESFSSPILYGYKGNHYFMYGVYIFK